MVMVVSELLIVSSSIILSLEATYGYLLITLDAEWQ
jgi:hypothetical protein